MFPFKKYAFAATIAASCGLAQAVAPSVTYEFSETFSGTVFLDGTVFPFTRSENLTLVPGGSSLPAILQSAVQQTITPFYASPSGQTYCYAEGGCTLTGSNANGSYTGLYWIDYYRRTNDIAFEYEYAGTFKYTGGTGVFSGISGGGSFTGLDTFGPDITENTSKIVHASFSLPVPEPETWATMLAGLALIGTVTRRSRLSSARLA